MTGTVLTNYGAKLTTHIANLGSVVACTSFGTFIRDDAGVWRWVRNPDTILQLP